MIKRAFGELESEILFILKLAGQRKTVKDVQQALGGQNNYNTIMTVMTRLAKKKLLDREKVGLHYEYWLTAPSTPHTFLQTLRKKFFGTSTRVLVSHLIETADDLSEQDLEEMEKIVEKMKRSKK